MFVTLGSTAELGMRRCVCLRETLYAFFLLRRAVYPFWFQNLTKDLRTEPKKKCSALMWRLLL